jgi:hypothetical protein
LIHLSKKESELGSVRRVKKVLAGILKHGLDNLFSLGNQRLLLVADDRPSHFLLETVGFICINHKLLVDFTAANGLIGFLPVQSFFNPSALFDDLQFDPINLNPEEEINLRPIKGCQFIHRAYRSSSSKIDWWKVYPESYSSFVNQPLTPSTHRYPMNQFVTNIVLSIEAEKGRWIGQVDDLIWIIKAINHKLVSDERMDIAFYVDGWTFSDFAKSNDIKSHPIVEKLEAVRQDLIAATAYPHIYACYDLLFSAKATFLSTCNLYITHHGTSSLLPSKILSIPTITIGTSKQLHKKHTVSEDNWYPHEATLDSTTADDPFMNQRYTVDASRLLDLIVSLIA